MRALDNTTKFASKEQFAQDYSPTALRFYLLEIARKLLPDERIRVCWRYPLPARKTIEIIYSDERERARCHGTMKCGSGWVCPACMSYIAERRRDELQTAIDRSALDMVAVMITYTVKHHQGDRLANLIAGMTSAYRKTRSGRYWQDVKQHYSVVGSVRSLEITYGESGWHPHFHELMFLSRSVLDANRAGSLDELTSAIRGDIGGQWFEKLRTEGYTTNLDMAFDVRAGNRFAAEYIAKFEKLPKTGVLSVPAYEITHTINKTPKNGNFGVLDMLFNAERDPKMRDLFLEYHSATKGRSAIHWSRGLKRLLDIEVIRDEIAAQGVETETDRLLAEIDLELWRFISYRGFIGQLMTCANTGDNVKVASLLDKIREQKEQVSFNPNDFQVGL